MKTFRTSCLIMRLSLLSLMNLGWSSIASAFTFHWTLIAQGKYFVELYKVGDVAPTRLYTTPELQHSWTAAFTNVPSANWYFYRVTNVRTGQAKQTNAFWPSGGDDTYMFLYWSKDFLGNDGSNLIWKR